MFSKPALKKMVQELSVPTLVSLTHETLDGIGEQLSKESLEVIGNIEIFAAEMRRRVEPEQQQQKPRRTKKEEETQTVHQFVVGGVEQ